MTYSIFPVSSATISLHRSPKEPLPALERYRPCQGLVTVCVVVFINGRYVSQAPKAPFICHSNTQKHTLDLNLQLKCSLSTSVCLCVSSCLSVSLCVSLSHTHTQRFGAHLKGNFPHLLSRDCFSFSHFSKNKNTKNTSCQMAQPSQLSPPEGSLRSAKPLELTVSPGTGREEVWGQGRESRTVRGPHSLRYPVNPWPLWARRNLRPTGGSEIFMTRTKSQRPRKRKGAPWAP